MDRKSLVVVILCVALAGLLLQLPNRLFPPVPVRVATNQAAATSNQVAGAPVVTTNGVSTNPASLTNLTRPLGSAGLEKFQVRTEVPEQLLVLTNLKARYTFTSYGGGLKLIELPGYPETVSVRHKKTQPTNGVATLNSGSQPPVLSVLWDEGLQGDGVYQLTPITNGVRAQKSLSNGLTVTKDFVILSNYLVNAFVQIRNDSKQPVEVPAQPWVVGTATPMDVDDSGLYLGAMWFDGVNPQLCPAAYFNTNTSVLGIFPRTPRAEYRAGSNNVVWAAVHNQFFALLAMPKQPAEQVVARAVDLPRFPGITQAPGSAPPQGVETTLLYPGQTLAPGAGVERQIVLFAGPKEFRTLAQIGGQFQNQADLVMNFGTGYAGFWGVGSFFAKLLLSAMNWLHDVTTIGYGWVIVLITILLRLIFLPFTAKAIRSSRKMQAIAPELKLIQEKYKDDVQKLMQKRGELMKKHDVSMLSGCLPTLIQMPVFFGFFSMIRCAIELRGANFLWVHDLTKSDTLFVIPGVTFVPFISTPDGLPFNLLPILMVGVMVWQAHLQPPSPGMDPSQQKMMRYMPLMFLLFLYNYSSGMALYMTVSTLSSAIQSKVITASLPPTPPAPPAAPVLTTAPKKKK